MTLPLLDYIAAARAAHAQQEYQRRDEYLRKAYKQVRGSRIAGWLNSSSTRN